MIDTHIISLDWFRIGTDVDKHLENDKAIPETKYSKCSKI